MTLQALPRNGKIRFGGFFLLKILLKSTEQLKMSYL